MAGNAPPRDVPGSAAEAQQRYGAAAAVRGAAGPVAGAPVISEDAEILGRVQAAREEFPDGTYGSTRPLLPGPDPNAAAHVQELLEALDGWQLGNRADRPQPRPQP
ncbi:hypothetical protein [Streptomyces sp. NPDC060198]|uniref:hypothetical protein n=1 Tax=Streptomyces sp. NPDC060198 TaxID=3347070 RepID=UPI0036518892